MIDAKNRVAIEAECKWIRDKFPDHPERAQQALDRATELALTTEMSTLQALKTVRNQITAKWWMPR